MHPYKRGTLRQRQTTDRGRTMWRATERMLPLAKECLGGMVRFQREHSPAGTLTLDFSL